MDSKKLEALAAAAEHGSFTRAAQQLGYTQSGLTHMMNSLEREIGFPVLVRDRRGVHLTPAGQRILPMVQQCLAANQALEREIAMINSHQEDTIRVGSYASIALHWLPELIEQFRRRHEGVGVDVQMGSVKEVYRWVREGRVDMAFTSRQENSTLDWTPLKPDPLLAILPRDFDTDGASSLDVRRLEGQEFLMPSLGFHLDIMRALVTKAGNLQIYTKTNRNKLLCITCAAIRKYYIDHQKGELKLALEPERKDRSYQWGRMLAVMEKIEDTAHWNKKQRNGSDDSKDRLTNAIRMQSAFVQRPGFISKQIMERLFSAYYSDLRPNQRVFFDRLIGEIMEQIQLSLEKPEDYGKPLTETYLPGYYLQKSALYTKKETEEMEEHTDEV